MAFDDYPIVDENSKLSEGSVTVVKAFFSQKYNFINREPRPDYGVDLDIEIIVDGKKASGWEFSIQIKSDKEVKIVSHDEKDFVSFQFQTSRLNYLCQKSPGYGLVIMFDEQKNTCYYDYVEVIVNRLTQHRKSEDWKKNENVNINIPIENVLTEKVTIKIHDKFCQRFRNHKTLLALHGKEFEIPSFDVVPPETLSELNSPQEIMSFLEKYGLSLFNRQEFLFMDNLLSKLTFVNITRSPKLLFIATITYEGMGKFIDAEYFLNKTLQLKDKYSSEDENLLMAVKAKIEYVLGDLSLKSYCDELENILKKNQTDSSSTISIKIRLLHLKVIKSGLDSEDLEKVTKEFDDLFPAIDSSNLPENIKHQYKVYLATSLLAMLTRMLIEMIATFKVREKVFHKKFQQERILVASFLMPVFQLACDIYQEALDFSVKNKEEALYAYVLYSQGLSFFLVNLNTSTMEDAAPIDIEKCKRQYQNLLVAYNYFLKLGLMDNAYQAITTAYDIDRMCILFLGKTIEENKENELIKVIQEIEKDTGRPQYISIVERLKDETDKIKETDTGVQMAMSSDSEIEQFATFFMQSTRLPMERKINVVNDYKFLREAYKELQDGRFEVIQNLKHQESKVTLYAIPMIYRLRCKKCDFTTKASKDLKELLFDKSARHPHVCL